MSTLHCIAAQMRADPSWFSRTVRELAKAGKLRRAFPKALVMTAAIAAFGSAGAAAPLPGIVAKHDAPDPLLRIMAQHVVLKPSAGSANGEQRFTLQCPLSYVPVRYSIAPAHENSDFYLQTGEELIDRNMRPLDRSALTSAAQLDGAGYALTLTSIGEARSNSWNLEIALACLDFSASTDLELSLARSVTLAPPLGPAIQVAYCTGDYPVALGGFSNSDPRSLAGTGSAPAWGAPDNPLLLQDLPDGETAAPSGWQSKVYNRYLAATAFVAYAICAKAPEVRAFIYSTSTAAGEPYSIVAPVPQRFIPVAIGSDDSVYGIDTGFDAWMFGGTVLNLEAWRGGSLSYDSIVSGVHAYIAHGVDGRPPSASALPTGRVVAAVLALFDSDAPAGSYNVDVVEYYNAALDHYFISANDGEILDLDRGVHPGWKRTGQSFKGYGVYSVGPGSRRPVCRVYGKPAFGLDSHFYSASYDECVATLTRFGGAWEFESAEVFQVEPPDPLTGACPADTVPVYRTWNQRADANHRYSTSIALRDQMIAKGHMAEGYGPEGVALCAPSK